jgi:hypothetical protein
MQFHEDMVAAILAGSKTQTRRPFQPYDVVKRGGPPFAEIQSVRRKGYLLWQVGKTYAVCPGRGKRGVGRILVKRIRDEWMSTISEEDALAEGFPSRLAFIERWRTMYGNDYPASGWIWVIEFELVKEAK